MFRFAFSTAWIIAVAIGSYALTAYELAPGEAGNSPELWPQNRYIAAHSDKPTLVMFVHPRCPCTRASIGELSIVMAKCHRHVETYVLAVQPQGVEDDWVQTDLLDQAKQIPGVNVLTDVDGILAGQFDAHTSGETLLYDKTGRRRFCGGITSSRGHHGENDGRRSIVDWILRGKNEQLTAPVFGCPLQNTIDTKTRN